MVVISQIKTG